VSKKEAHSKMYVPSVSHSQFLQHPLGMTCFIIMCGDYFMVRVLLSALFAGRTASCCDVCCLCSRAVRCGHALMLR
jgi:hypothetical protein